MTFMSPRKKLTTLSEKRHHMWVVCYVNKDGSNLVESAVRDLESTFEGGGDAAILINEWCSLAELENTMAEVRKRYPKVALGVNYLGDESEPYGYRDSFRLAKDYNLQVVWTDFTGVDLINEKPRLCLHDVEELRPEQTFYCSGVHMKYSTLKDPQKTIEQSALQALGWVDGVIVTGPKTGVPCDPETARRARSVIGDYPLGVASGVSPENFHTIAQYIDFCLVASSLQSPEKRIVTSKVRALRQAMDEMRK